MKAKEYVAFYHTISHKPEDDINYELAEKLFKETQDLVRIRKCERNEAFLAVFKEMEKKWQAACSLEPKLWKPLYEITIKAYLPKIYTFCVRDGLWR